ncbi:hypothetical protein V6N11_055821 [Hibiscus sabdariffa]|uniref:Uncharacterized protein n=1 Tax=Hibiscus sabdariffa TaxID=183260 RepID=A0ABR1ZM53_9ROSI
MSNKRARMSLDKAVVDVWQRELGGLSSRNFAQRLAASEDLVLRLDIYKKLEEHQDDRSLVTCAADGEVRHAQILERSVETRLLTKHQGWAHKLAIEPGSPHILYTCGEDGLVQHIDLRTAAATELFTCYPIDDSRAYMGVINLNAIVIDPRNPNLFAVAGSDDSGIESDIKIWTPKALHKAILPTNIEQCKPKPRGWMYRITSPQDLMLRLLSWQRRGSRPERNGENSSEGGEELLDLILTSDTKSDDASSDDGENDSGPDNLFS